jgi:hypothetical protein
VAARFPSYTKIAASHAPFRTVRSDAAPARACLCEQMRKFVSERLLNFRAAMFAKAWIQGD